MSTPFKSAASLSSFMKAEQERALDYICKELACERESVAFIIDGSDADPAALEIPCGRELLLTN